MKRENLIIIFSKIGIQSMEYNKNLLLFILLSNIKKQKDLITFWSFILD